MRPVCDAMMLLILMGVFPRISARESLFVACDDHAEVFLDGVQFTDPAMDHWDKTSEISLPFNTKTIAIFCRNSGGPYGIKASTDSGIVTDGTWRCNNIKEDNWMMTDFDDSTWKFAKTDNLYVYTALSRPQISTSAEWIWSQIGTDQAYCRKSISQAEVKLKAVSAWQSSTHRFYHARYCIDGHTVKQCTWYCYCATRYGAAAYPWIVLDLGKTVHVKRVVFDGKYGGFLGQLRMSNSRPSPNDGYLSDDGELFAKIDNPTPKGRWEAWGNGKYVAGRYLVVQQRFKGDPTYLKFVEITAFGYV